MFPQEKGEMADCLHCPSTPQKGTEFWPHLWASELLVIQSRCWFYDQL